ncbi:MAG: LUD domain-containing protein [Chloroflexi bacterium]|nr:LUD domain-containing protein [Chloroflexota bacterium]
MSTPTLTTSERYTVPASDEVVERTAEALRGRGFEVRIAADRDAAREAVFDLIPVGSEVNQASSLTVDTLGIGDALVEREEYVALKPRLWAMDRETHAREFRQQFAGPDVVVGSVHAVTEDGQLVAASMSGSQLGMYAGGAGHVVLVVGTQKIVPDLDSAFARIEDHVFPLEDARAQEVYGMHSAINKLLVIRGDMPGRLAVVLVRDAIGF